MRILLVEDDSTVASAVRDALSHAGFQVEWLADGPRADAVLSCTSYDLVVLDVGLPGFDGMELLRRQRTRGLTFPVLMLTARDTLQDRVGGLDDGADDYLTKPFELPELVARCHALVRRGRNALGAVLSCGALKMDVRTQEARLRGLPLALTGREWSVLLQLVLAAPAVVAKDKLVDSLGGWDQEITPNAVEIYVSRLRGKLTNSGLGIRTVRGLGYRLEEDAAS